MRAGIGGGSWSTLIARELAGEIHPPKSCNDLLVFALPGDSGVGATSNTGLFAVSNEMERAYR